MQELLIITPVKDSIDHTIRTMEAVVQSELTVPHRYVVYNDNSTPENTMRLHAEGQRLGVEVVDLADLTDHPSPNYLFVLRRCRKEALATDGAKIMTYLAGRHGRMPYGDGTSAPIIKDKFNISKAAFKRALGHLMKAGFVVQEEGWTLLTEAGQKTLLAAEEQQADSAE